MAEKSNGFCCSTCSQFNDQLLMDFIVDAPLRFYWFYLISLKEGGRRAARCHAPSQRPRLARDTCPGTQIAICAARRPYGTERRFLSKHADLARLQLPPCQSFFYSNHFVLPQGATRCHAPYNDDAPYNDAPYNARDRLGCADGQRHVAASLRDTGIRESRRDSSTWVPGQASRCQAVNKVIVKTAPPRNAASVRLRWQDHAVYM